MLVLTEIKGNKIQVQTFPPNPIPEPYQRKSLGKLLSWSSGFFLNSVLAETLLRSDLWYEEGGAQYLPDLFEKEEG